MKNKNTPKTDDKTLKLEVKKIKASIRGGAVMASKTVALDSGGY